MNRKEELNHWENIIFSLSISKAELNAAYKKGMLKKNELEDGQYYLGYCRNAYVAKWVEKENAFFYMRNKLGDYFPEKIYHPEDDNNRDLFIPFKQVKPTPEETIKVAKITNFLLQKKQE